MSDRWQLGDLVKDLSTLAMPVSLRVKAAMANIVTKQPYWVAYEPATEKIAIVVDPEHADVDELTWLSGALKYAGLESTYLVMGEQTEDSIWIKVAVSPFLSNVAEIGQFKHSDSFPNAPSPLAATLAGGAIGAGAGYGLGYLGEKLMPRTWERGKLRKTLAALGGVAGAAPGIAWGGVNLANDHGVLDDWPFQRRAVQPPITVPDETAHLGLDFKGACEKFAYEDFDNSGFGDLPPVNIGAMGETLWNDPHVAGGLSPIIRNATQYALDTAQHMPGGIGPGWVTPMQMGHLAAGMGAGYLSGALVGGALGILTGMPQDTQNTLKRTGMYVGLLQQVIPKLFGG